MQIVNCISNVTAPATKHVDSWANMFWQSAVTFDGLVEMMVEADLRRVSDGHPDLVPSRVSRVV